MTATQGIGLLWAVGALTRAEFTALQEATQRLAVLELLFDAVEYEIGIGTELPNAIAVAWQGAARTQERGS